MLIESPLGSPLDDLERLIDEQTPYFKARIEELPVQGRRVFHCLAAGWSPMLAKEVAFASKLSSSHASAQLRQLVEKGFARELKLPREKRVRYEIVDRFYNIYHLLRFSRTGRQRLERLVHFLHDLFGPIGMRAMYPAAPEVFPEREWPAGYMSDTLSDVSARRRDWTETIGLLEHAVRIGDDEFQIGEWPGLTESLIGLVSARPRATSHDAHEEGWPRRVDGTALARGQGGGRRRTRAPCPPRSWTP